ncbi:MAG: DNA-binding protein [Candidatus ainarchaeum sp.]|nr:DNA-binding protein [Candidatus ainarchaeum sp.]
MDELENARAKRLKEMQEAQKEDEQIRAAMRAMLDENGYNRMMNVRLASPELYAQAVQGCASVYQRLGRKLGEREILLILKRLKGGERETKITFERK